MTSALLEATPKGHAIGRDPRKVTQAELEAAGHARMSPLRALRLRCLDCCAGSPDEVRLCTAVTCPSWPFRAGSNPWRAEPSEARRESSRKTMRDLRAAGLGGWGRQLGVAEESTDAGA